MQSLTNTKRLSGQERQAALGAAHETEAQLLEQCEALDRRVTDLQADVRRKSEKLLARDAHGWFLNRHRRDLQKQHAHSAAENAGAQQILQLQRSTAAHLERVSEQCSEADQSVASAQRDSAK